MAVSPPFVVNESAPADDDIVSQFPLQNRNNMDHIESWLNFISDATTGSVKVPVDTTTNLDAISSAPIGALQYDTTLGQLRVKISSGPAVFDNIGFPAGTRLTFQQSSAPPGWTKVTDAAYEDAVMLLTTGTVATAGTIAADEFLLVDDHFMNNEVLGSGTTESSGAHTHTVSWAQNSTGAGNLQWDIAADGADTNRSLTSSSDGAHTHTFATIVNNSEEDHMFGDTANSVKTVEFIVCEKD